jgi:hypothetical protein
MDQVVNVLRMVLLFGMASAAAYFMVVSIHWQLMVDAPIMHYVNFLIDHGRKPYTDITDNNMPGAYYTEALAMHVFGSGDVAWRIYDYFLLITLTASLAWIAKTYDWLAGFFAGCLFITVHAAEGPKYLVEREQVLTVLLVIGYAGLFAAVRHRRPALMLVLGIAGGLATSIKPTFLLLPLALMLIAAFVLRRRGMAAAPYMLWSFAGLVAIAALDVGYLQHYGALEGFWFVLRTVSPAYSSLARFSFWRLMALSLPEYIPLLLLLTIAASFANRKGHPAWSWEKWAIAAGAGIGLLSFIVQGKPFLHHRYTWLVLLFLLMGFELFDALRQRGLPRALAFVAFAYVMLWIIPMSAREVIHVNRHLIDGQVPFVLGVEADLQQLGGANTLQDKVQCFDLVYGCLNALNRLQIVENTSYTGDLLLFAKHGGPAAEYYRDKYWALERQDPANVILMSNEWFQQKNSFDKVAMWPPFKEFLLKNYTLAVERTFSGQGDDPLNPDGYRIYIRDGSPLMARGLALRGVQR